MQCREVYDTDQGIKEAYRSVTDCRTQATSRARFFEPREFKQPRNAADNTLGPRDAYASVNWIIIGSGNGLSPTRRQAITWTGDDLLSIRTIRKNNSEIWMQYFS